MTSLPKVAPPQLFSLIPSFLLPFLTTHVTIFFVGPPVSPSRIFGITDMCPTIFNCVLLLLHCLCYVSPYTKSSFREGFLATQPLAQCMAHST
jgi:hypothetical protein